jgi:hypothetical protein
LKQSNVQLYFIKFLIQLTTIELIVMFSIFYYRELLLNQNFLRVLPYELGKLFQLQVLGLQGNPLSKEIMALYGEPSGTHKLLSYMLDNLQGTV